MAGILAVKAQKKISLRPKIMQRLQWIFRNLMICLAINQAKLLASRKIKCDHLFLALTQVMEICKLIQHHLRRICMTVKMRLINTTPMPMPCSTTKAAENGKEPKLLVILSIFMNKIARLLVRAHVKIKGLSITKICWRRGQLMWAYRIIVKKKEVYS